MQSDGGALAGSTARGDHTHNVGVEGLDVDVADGAAGEGPHLSFVFEGSSDLQEDVQQ